MKKTIIIVAIALFVFIGLNTIRFFYNDDNAFLKRHNLYGLTVVEMVEELERRIIDPNELMVSISGDTLTLNEPNKIITLAIPNQLFYLSFAPYISNTHPCGNHNLTTCRGEMVEQTFRVFIVNNDDDTILFDGDVTTELNGFAGVWLPRGLDVTVSVFYDDLTATTQLTTFADSDTCLTTLRLT